jgi:CubicO group peptidase (beta-lactamase class C family)
MMHRSKSALAAALSFFLLLAASGRAQAPSPPDTPQGRRIAALITAFETGTPEAIRAFVTANFAASAQKEVPLEQRVERIGGMAREVGPIAFQQMLPSQAPEIRFLARAKKTQQWFEIGMMLERPPDFGILGWKIDDSQGPGAPAESRKGSDAEVAAAADALLSAEHGDNSFSGVVLIAKNGKPFFHKAYGMANRDFGVPNRRDTKFNLGSINKVFTQVAIAQLAEQGKLSLSDTIRKHLPDYPSPVADKITIQQLLTMTSGLGDFFGERFDATPKSRFRTLADFLPMFVNEPLLFEPGTSRSYSNAGYIVLGLIIEKVSAKSYYDYVRQHVFIPAGMKDTDAYMQDAIVPNRAVGYTRESEDGKPHPGPKRTNVYTLPARSSSAGGGYSTAPDLLAFDAAMRSDKLLSPAWTGWYFSDKSKAPVAGAAPRKHSGGSGFAGGSPGVNGVIETDLDTGYSIVVLSNDDPPSAETVAKKIRQWLGLN